MEKQPEHDPELGQARLVVSSGRAKRRPEDRGDLIIREALVTPLRLAVVLYDPEFSKRVGDVQPLTRRHEDRTDRVRVGVDRRGRHPGSVVLNRPAFSRREVPLLYRGWDTGREPQQSRPKAFRVLAADPSDLSILAKKSAEQVQSSAKQGERPGSRLVDLRPIFLERPRQGWACKK